ncbi:MAG: FKBP-type peptidyl-prolyl cis-trans isomerase [Candidatus Saccharibacteria bacterium]|nr:FKBP-type peptidyl-prolyl cis-trans isomerase [Candidatus Saccharibacteria bacterium]
MEEKELRTSVKQRIFISVIALIMVGTFIASYAGIIISGNSSGSSSSSSDTTMGLSEEKIAAYKTAYDNKVAEFKAGTTEDFAKFKPYVTEVKAYNETSANENGVVTRDFVVGDGRELSEGDEEYLAYYIGWCADESVFDSSLDNPTSPTGFNKALDASLGMIEGWTTGVVGMKLGGVREITIPGNLAYADQMEICGGLNKPLKFIVMAVAKEDPLETMALELDTAYMKYQYALYGIDYDEQFGE